MTRPQKKIIKSHAPETMRDNVHQHQLFEKNKVFVSNVLTLTVVSEVLHSSRPSYKHVA